MDDIALSLFVPPPATMGTINRGDFFEVSAGWRIEGQFISGTHSYAQQDYKIGLVIGALYTRH